MQNTDLPFVITQLALAIYNNRINLMIMNLIYTYTVKQFSVSSILIVANSK